MIQSEMYESFCLNILISKTQSIAKITKKNHNRTHTEQKIVKRN